MGGAVTGLAADAGIVGAHAVEIGESGRPLVKAGDILRNIEIGMAVEAVGFLEPGCARMHLGGAGDLVRSQVVDQLCRPRFGLLTAQQRHGVLLEGAVAFGAGDADLLVEIPRAAGGAVRFGRMAGGAGGRALQVHIVGVPAVHGGRKIEAEAVPPGADCRIGVAALAEGRLARPRLREQVGAAVAVMGGEDIDGGLVAHAGHAPLPGAAVAAAAAHLRGDRRHHPGAGKQAFAGFIPGLDREGRVGVEGADVIVGGHRDHLGGVGGEIGLVFHLAREPFARQTDILRQFDAEIGFHMGPEGHLAGRIFKPLLHLVAQGHPFRNQGRGRTAADELGVEGVGRGQDDKPGVAVGHAVHPQVIPGQKEIVVLAAVKGGDLFGPGRRGQSGAGKGGFGSLPVQPLHDPGRQGLPFRRGSGHRGHVTVNLALAVQEREHPLLRECASAPEDIIAHPADGVAGQALNIEKLLARLQPVFRSDLFVLHPAGVGEHPLLIEAGGIGGMDRGAVHIAVNDPGLAGDFAQILKTAVESQTHQHQHDGKHLLQPARRFEQVIERKQKDGRRRDQPDQNERLALGIEAESHLPGRGGDAAVIPPAGRCHEGQSQQQPFAAVTQNLVAGKAVGHPHRGENAKQSSDHHCHAGAEEGGGEVGRVEEPVPEAGGLEPFARGEHKGEDTVDDHQAEPGEKGVEKGDVEAGPFIQLAEIVMIDEQGGDLAEEKDPFDRPAEDKGMDQGGGGCGLDQSDDEPDAHTGDAAEDHGQEQKKPGVPAHIDVDFRVVLAESLPVHQPDENAATDGEMGNIGVQYGDQGDQRTAAEPGQLPDWIVHWPSLPSPAEIIVRTMYQTAARPIRRMTPKMIRRSYCGLSVRSETWKKRPM